MENVPAIQAELKAFGVAHPVTMADAEQFRGFEAAANRCGFNQQEAEQFLAMVFTNGRKHY